jgi:hypothetical protein
LGIRSSCLVAPLTLLPLYVLSAHESHVAQYYLDIREQSLPAKELVSVSLNPATSIRLPEVGIIVFAHYLRVVTLREIEYSSVGAVAMDGLHFSSPAQLFERRSVRLGEFMAEVGVGKANDPRRRIELRTPGVAHSQITGKERALSRWW